MGTPFLNKPLCLTVTSLLLSLLPAQVLASACCGGAFSIPAIITGDDAGQLSTSFSQSKVEADVTATGVWRKRDTSDVSQILKIDGAHVFADRFQAGFSLPVQMRTRDGVQGGTSSGLGDMALQGAYEYLPDWDYNPYRPKGVGFLTLTLPTGKSLEESLNEDAGLSARGRGYWAFGGGTVLTKSYRAWDLNSTLEFHRSFAKTVNDTTLTPGSGGSFALGAGWNTAAWRFGGSIAWNQEDAVKITGATNSEASPQRYATGSLMASYLFPENWTGIVSYSDQTLFGNPENAILSKSAMILLQKRWAR
jgi:hypothetical protein